MPRGMPRGMPQRVLLDATQDAVDATQDAAEAGVPTYVFVPVATRPGNTASTMEEAGPRNWGKLVSRPALASVICTYSCLNVGRDTRTVWNSPTGPRIGLKTT